MIDNVEFILKIVFFILSIIWIGKIMILRTDKQIVINPLLLGIASILVVLPDVHVEDEFLGISIQNIKISLYVLYSLVVIWGIYATNQKNGIF